MREKGSRRRWKACREVARHHERIANRRRDFIFKVVANLFRKYDIVIAEDLQIPNMIRNPKLSKSIADASWGAFFRGCAGIAERDGLHFHQVNPHNTSQTCSFCQTKAEKKFTLSDRTFTCKACGFSLDRDHNAALTLLYRAADALRGASAIADTLKREFASHMACDKHTPMPLGLGI